MKNWIYAALAALFATGCAPHGGYTLTGEVPEAWEGKSVVLFTTDAGQAEAIDSTTVANGKFRLQGVLDAPRNCRVAVYLDPENRSDRNLTVTFPVFLDSTAVNAVCDASKSDPVFTLAGGATQTEWQAYRAALEPLAEERNRAFRDYVEAFYNGGDEAKGSMKRPASSGISRSLMCGSIPLRRSASPSCRNFATASRGWIGCRWSR